MEERLPRKLAAIMYADVAGYSRLTGEDEDATHRTLNDYLNLISQTISSHGGQVMHYAGDAVLAKFDAVIDSVSSATDIQKLLEGRNECSADERKLQFRIGLNLGDVIEDRGDIYGDGVNIAARLESLADSGGICISESIRTAIGNKLDLEFEDIGEQTVKNIAEPVKAYRIKGIGTVGTATSLNRSEQVQSTEKPSIVVLPFKNMSPDSDSDYFVDGIAEEIMSCLGRYREILVSALKASFQVNTETSDASEAARRLGVSYALSGSVRRAGNRVRIVATLIDGEAGQQVWSEQYDRVLDDIFELQDEVAQKIVTMLVAGIERSGLERSLRKETNSLSAYECVLRGRHLWGDWQGTEDQNNRAREMFEQAIELDPRYAVAYAGLAATYHQDGKYKRGDNPELAGEKCIELAKKAIELDEHDSFAHLVLSSAYWRFKGNFELAKSQLDTAINLNPNYYWNYCYGCWFSACYGDLETSRSQGKEAIRRNPLLPDGCLHSLGFTEYLAGDYEAAITTICQITQLEPESYACLAASYAQLGRIDEAKKVASECVEHSGDCAMDIGEWQKFWDDKVDFRHQAQVDHLVEGLDKAGLVIR